MSKIRYRDIMWFPFPASCELCRKQTSMAMIRQFSLQMRCGDHMIPQLHGRDVPMLERELKALVQTKLTIQTECELPASTLLQHIEEMRNTYTYHWLLNAHREEDATNYRAHPDVRAPFDEQTHLSISCSLPEQDDAPAKTDITFDAPVSLVHLWSLRDLVEELLGSGRAKRSGGVIGSPRASGRKKKEQ